MMERVALFSLSRSVLRKQNGFIHRTIGQVVCHVPLTLSGPGHGLEICCPVLGVSADSSIQLEAHVKWGRNSSCHDRLVRRCIQGAEIFMYVPSHHTSRHGFGESGQRQMVIGQSEIRTHEISSLILIRLLLVVQAPVCSIAIVSSKARDKQG